MHCQGILTQSPQKKANRPQDIQRIAQRKLKQLSSAITADTALRLARFFGTDAQSWMNLQAEYDLETAEITLSERIERAVKPLKEAA